MKIIHLPTSLCGLPYGLSQGERSIGLESDTLVMYTHNNSYPSTYTLFDRSYSKNTDILRISSTLVKLLVKYDVFHFNYGNTLIDSMGLGIPLLDLPLYKLCNKKIIVTYSGCDIRQKYAVMDKWSDSACANANCYHGICNSGTLDSLRKKKLAKFDKYADTIFTGSPDLFFLLPERTIFLPYTLINWDNIVSKQYIEHTPIKIVHASTDRGCKGTNIIIDVFLKLKEKYNDKIELIIVENMTNEDALNIYKTADLIIDQLYIGWYGVFATECMKMGTPVMSFIRDENLEYIPAQMEFDLYKSIISVTPATLYDTLCTVIEDPNILKTYSHNSLKYVNKWHNPTYSAGIAKQAYEN